MNDLKILVTGGAGFIGSNLIKTLKENYPGSFIVSLDNYFTGKTENHELGVEYIYGHTKDTPEIFKNRSFDIVFHFGEYSRIVHSFNDIEIVADSILVGTPIILELTKQWDAKLIYSASSSKFGNEGKNENLSPYSWAKAKMVELIKNYGKWFELDYEICYFFNVYGPGQIDEGPYSTVVGIFEKQFKAGKKCTIVKPGTQTRDFTHVDDVIDGLIKVCKRNDRKEWYLRSGVNISMFELAEMYGVGYKMIDERLGERFSSEEFESDTNKILDWYPKRSLKKWIEDIKVNL